MHSLPYSRLDLADLDKLSLVLSTPLACLVADGSKSEIIIQEDRSTTQVVKYMGDLGTWLEKRRTVIVYDPKPSMSWLARIWMANSIMPISSESRTSTRTGRPSRPQNLKTHARDVVYSSIFKS